MSSARPHSREDTKPAEIQLEYTGYTLSLRLAANVLGSEYARRPVIQLLLKILLQLAGTRVSSFQGLQLLPTVGLFQRIAFSGIRANIELIAKGFSLRMDTLSQVV